MKFFVGFVNGCAAAAAAFFFLNQNAGIEYVPHITEREDLIKAIEETEGAGRAIDQSVDQVIKTALNSRPNPSQLTLESFKQAEAERIKALREPSMELYRQQYDNFTTRELRQYLACERSEPKEKERANDAPAYREKRFQVWDTMLAGVRKLVDEKLGPAPPKP